MNFYVASSFKNKDNVRSVASELKKEGFCQTYDWTINDRADSMELLASIGEKERNAVANSDILVVLLPGGKGCHIEMGMALALGKTVYLYSPVVEDFEDLGQTSTFYHVEGVKKFVGTLESFLEFLLTEEAIVR
jgi:nucleoside 2-deoxyribosyltransferase